MLCHEVFVRRLKSVSPLPILELYGGSFRLFKHKGVDLEVKVIGTVLDRLLSWPRLFGHTDWQIERAVVRTRPSCGTVSNLGR